MPDQQISNNHATKISKQLNSLKLGEKTGTYLEGHKQRLHHGGRADRLAGVMVGNFYPMQPLAG